MVFSPTLCSKQGSPNLGQVAHGLMLSVWRISKDRDLTTSLVLVPDLHHSGGRIFFHMSNQNFLQTGEKSLCVSLLCNPVRQWMTAARYPLDCLFSRLNKPSALLWYLLLSCPYPLLHHSIFFFFDDTSLYSLLLNVSPIMGHSSFGSPKGPLLTTFSKKVNHSTEAGQRTPCHQDRQRRAPEKH